MIVAGAAAAPNPMLVEDAHDLVAIVEATGRTALARKWVDELRAAAEESGLEGFVP